jgi:hydrogenase-4 component F
LAIPLVAGLLLGVGGLFFRLNALAFGRSTGSKARVEASYIPLFAHLALVLAAGVFLPAPLVTWFQNVAELLG